ELHIGEDPVPIVIRSSAGETTAAEDLQGLDVARPAGGAVPLAQVARIEADWRPAAIKHRNRRRMVTVSSQLAEGFTFSDVLQAFGPRLEALELPEGVTVGLGGDAEGSNEANAAMVRTMPIGILILLGVLLAEFNSFRRVMIILVTVPLAAAGVIPGLLISGQPFGFMSLLGVIALVGIVVNNAIVLLEVVDGRRREGATVDEALGDAVVLRIRPILLTTATTVAGLLPLALSSSTLWPPLASAMISGLLASTLLTLVVVPALYRVLFSGNRGATGVRFASQAAAAGLLLMVPTSPLMASDRAVTLEESMRLAGRRPAAEAARLQAEAVAQGAHAERRLSYLPMVGASVSASDRNRDLALTTPLGQFELGVSRANSAGVEVVQPLFDPARHLYANPASRAESEAAGLVADRTRQELAAVGGLAHLRALDLEARLRSTVAFVKSLEARLLDTEARVDAGRALEADALKIRLALERAQLEFEALEQARRVASADLGRSVGLDGPASALGVDSWVDRPAPPFEILIDSALESRADLGALAGSAEALALRRSAVKAEALPSFNASVAWSWTDGSPYSVDSWAEGALSLNWKVFAAGTRAPRVRALQAEQEATERQLLEARRAVEVEIRSVLAALKTARSAVGVSERGVEQATENLRVERERHVAGRITTNDLLVAEAELREQRTLFRLAHVEVVRSWINLWLATGERDLGVLFG
ncbi:MAG: efflux RND transporter permease subunit, partial [Acidobacteriota bacterium]